MKNVIAIAAILASSSTFAFFGDNNGDTNGYVGHNGNGEFVGNGTGRGEADFTMEVEAEGKTYGSFAGDGKHNGNLYGNGYASDRNEDGSLVSGTDTASEADLAGNGAGEGKFKMKIGFKARGQMDADTRANGDTSANGYGYGYSSPYYGQNPHYSFAAPAGVYEK